MLEPTPMLLMSLVFWAFLASYFMHIIDESLLNGGFVNAAAIGAIALSIILFDSLGGHWIILPLTWVEGLVTHVLTVQVRYGLDRELVTGADFAIGMTVGAVMFGGFLTVGPTWFFPRLTGHRR